MTALTQHIVPSTLQVRSWDIEVCDAVSPASIHNGSCYIDAAAESAPPPVRLPAPAKLPACSAPTSRPQPRKPQAFKLEGALILDEPSEGGSPAFVPEFLARRLRPHQERGVKFLYNVRTHCSSKLGTHTRPLHGGTQLISLCMYRIFPGPCSDVLSGTSLNATCQDVWFSPLACVTTTTKHLAVSRVCICQAMLSVYSSLTFRTCRL